MSTFPKLSVKIDNITNEQIEYIDSYFKSNKNEFTEWVDSKDIYNLKLGFRVYFISFDNTYCYKFLIDLIEKYNANITIKKVIEWSTGYKSMTADRQSLEELKREYQYYKEQETNK